MVLCLFCVSKLNRFEIVIFAVALCTGKHKIKSVNGRHYKFWH